MSEILVNTIKKADGTGSLTVPAETGTVLTTVTSAASVPTNTGKHFFHAYRSTDQSVANNNNVIAIFDTEFADVSSAYNTSTGEFTVPEDGLYFFVASLYHASSGNSNLWNGKTRIRHAASVKLVNQFNYGSNYPNEVTHQASGIIDCTAGDVIDVQFSVETSSGSGSKLTGGTPTYFLGVMIA